MSGKNEPKTRSREDGFVLAVIIVFLVVLSLTAFLVASMTRTDVQVVQNIQREKEAFFVAEAGATEALLRLRRVNVAGNEVTIGGLNFDPDIVPEPTDPDWNARITFTLAPPSLVSSTLTTPSIQPPGNRLPYSEELGGEHPFVTIRWTDKTVSARPVLEVASQGRSHRARRTVTIHAIQSAAQDDDGNPGCRAGGCFFSTACNAVKTQGNCNLTMDGGMVINSPCLEEALTCGSNQSIEAAGGIDIVGGYTGACSMDPSPNTGADGIEDPFRNLAFPADRTCDYQNTKITGSSSVTLKPGVYCGGISWSGTGDVTLEPGPYIIHGGALSLTGGGDVTSLTAPVDSSLGSPFDGVTFFVTEDPQSSVNLGPNRNVSLVSSTEGDYAGMLIFQHRDNTNTVNIGGTFRTGLDGLVYAIGAHINLQNQTNPGKTLQTGFIASSLECVGDNSLVAPSSGGGGGGGDNPNHYEVVGWDG